MDRRTIVQGAAAAGAAGVVASSFAPKQAFSETPKRGGHVRLGLKGGGISDTLDPATLADSMPFVVNWASRNCLVEIDANGIPQGELATSWETPDTGKTWRFNLRKGVEFHNGKTMTARDVAYSINYHRGEDSKSAAKPLVDPIADITTDGDTVIFTLESRNVDFPITLSDTHLVIVPEGTKGEAWDECIGTGGYLLKEWEPGVRSLSVRNPNYWKSGRAHFEEVEILNVSDVTSRMNAIRGGVVDIIISPDIATLHLLSRLPDIQIVEVPGSAHTTIPMMTDEAPFDDNNVRLAIKYAIDREQFIEKVLKGHGAVANDHPIGPGYRYHNTELPQRQYDPEKAKFHLKKAGLTTISVNLSAADAAFAGAVDAAVLYRESAARAGIDINVVREPNDGYWSNVWLKKPWCMVHWNGRSTEDLMLSTAYAAGAKWNETAWDNERFNQLLLEARSQTDDDLRRELYFEMQKIIHDDCGAVVPYFDNYVMAAKSNLRFGKIANNWNLDGYRLAERWWFS